MNQRIELNAEAATSSEDNNLEHVVSRTYQALTMDLSEMQGCDRLQQAVPPSLFPKLDTYPLTPMQQGMLYTHLAAPHSGIDLLQTIFTLPEAINFLQLKRAWIRVVNRHPALRTSIHWDAKQEEAPSQSVHAQARVQIGEHDLRRLALQERRAEVARYLENDRTRGFHFHEAPLMRLVLFRLGDTEYQLIWSVPHIILDGSSLEIITREVFLLYEAAMSGKPEPKFPKPRPFRKYLDWLTERDSSGDEAYWHAVLKGFTAPTPIGFSSRAEEPSSAVPVEHEARLSTGTTLALHELARCHGVTPESFISAAWGLVISRYSREDDVVFGTSRAGRRLAHRGIAGILLTTTPVRVRAAAGTRLLPWLRQLHTSQVEARDHEHAALIDIQRGSDVPRGTALFDSLVVADVPSLPANRSAMATQIADSKLSQMRG